MDPVSFALSVASLAALYSNCVACFSAFKSCQSFERDHKILVTKLDVEKTILLQWGDRVGLISGRKRDLDPRLYEKRTNAAIAQVLRCIEMLLTDTDKLEKTYGLKPDRNGPSSARADMVSRHRMKNFERSHPEYESRVRYSRRDVNIVTKMRWAISDRNKFGSLVNEIRGFVSSLDRLIPTSQKIKLRLIEEDLNALGSSVQNLRLVEEATAFYHGDWSDAASDRATASEIASSAIGRSRSSPRRFGTEAEVAVDVNAWQERLVTEAVPACEQSSKPLRSRKTTDRQPECLSRERFTNIPPDSSSGDLSCSCKAIIAWKELLMRYDLSSKVQGLEARSYQPLSMRDFRNFAVDYYRLVTLYFELTNNILRWVIRVSELEECQMHTRHDSETTELETNDIAAISYVISLISLNGFVEDYFGLLWDHIKDANDIEFCEVLTNSLRAKEGNLQIMMLLVRRGGSAEQTVCKVLTETKELRLLLCYSYGLEYVKVEEDVDLCEAADEFRRSQSNDLVPLMETCVLKGYAIISTEGKAKKVALDNLTSWIRSTNRDR